MFWIAVLFAVAVWKDARPDDCARQIIETRSVVSSGKTAFAGVFWLLEAAAIALDAQAFRGSAIGACRHLDCPSDHFRDLRDDCISKGVNSVHPIGRPIIHSSKLAQRHFPISVPRNGLLRPPHSSNRPQVWFLPPFTPLGVGNNPEALPLVRGTSEGSGYTAPLRIIPERGKVAEDSSKSEMDKTGNVFDDGNFRPKLTDKPCKF